MNPDPPESLGSQGRQSFLTGVILALAIIFVAGVRISETAQELKYPYDLVNAAYGAFVTEAVYMARGNPIYTSPQTRPYFSTAYPPLFSATIRMALPFFDRPVVAARWTGAILLIMASVLAFSIVHTRTGSLLAGFIAALSLHLYLEDLLACHYNLFHLAQLGAVSTLVLYREKPTRWRLAAAVFLVSAVPWTRQTGFLLPVLCLFVFWRTSWRFTLAFCSITFVGGILLHAALGIVTQGESFRNSFSEVGAQPFREMNLQKSLEFGMKNLIALAAVCLIDFSWRKKSNAVKIFLIIGGFTALAGVITASKVGSDPRHQIIGYQLLWIAALMVWAPLKGRRRWVATLFLLITVFFAYRPMRQLAPHDWTHGARLEKLVKETPGPVLTDRHLGVLLPFKTPEYDLARVWEGWRYTGIEPKQLIEDLNSHRYDLILTSRYYETPEVKAAIDQNYFMDTEIRVRRPWFYVFQVLRPREEDSTAESPPFRQKP